MLFPAGRRALLDLYERTTTRSPGATRRRFSPRRWSGRAPGPFDFVPQGGADARTHHRCPGEDVAILLMLVSLQMLLTRMQYRVAAGAAEIDMGRLPALPRRASSSRTCAPNGVVPPLTPVSGEAGPEAQ